MPEIDKAVADLKLTEYYDRALSLIVSGRLAMPSSLRKNRPRSATFMAGTPSARAASWPDA
jgi:hypothetical protein